jgi:hypothetical protein
MRTSHLSAAWIAGVVLVQISAARGSYVIVPNPTGTESSADLFDVSTGATATASSANPNGPVLSDPRSAIGYSNTGANEPGNFYFADGLTAGNVDTLTITTPKPVTISGFNYFTYDDSYSGAANANRGVSQIMLDTSSDGTNYSPIQTIPLSNSYQSAYGSPGLEIIASFAPITAKYFRFDLTRYNTTGPRIEEIDATVPEPGALALVSIAFLGLRRRRLQQG